MEMKLTKEPEHIPEGYWWKIGNKIYFSEAKP